MKVARHWVREVMSFPRGGHEGEAGCWGWSADSVQDARADSRAATERLIDWLVNRSDQNLRRRGEYGYPERPPREEIVREFHDPAGEPVAVVTRNAYGALVLNTRDLGFFDVDLPQAPRATIGDAIAGLGKLVGKLLGRSASPPEPEQPPEEATLARIRTWAASHTDVAMRVYRTASGFRLMVTDRPLAAVTEQAATMLRELECDPLYQRLCRVQECFRARLTPKPWRIGHRAPPNHFPWLDASAEETYRQWQSAYEAAAEQYATCRLVEEHGPRVIQAELAPLVELHDSLTRCGVDLPLA